MMSANKDMIRNAESKVTELENIVALRQDLIAATRVDSFEPSALKPNLSTSALVARAFLKPLRFSLTHALASSS